MTNVAPLLLSLLSPSSPQDLTPDELVARARALFEESAKSGAFSGAMLLARGEEVLLTFACGEAS